MWYLGVVQHQRNKNGCHGSDGSWILGIIAFFNQGDVDLHIHTKFDFMW